MILLPKFYGVKNLRRLFLCTIICLLLSCKQERRTGTIEPVKTTIKYAKGFDIQYQENQIKLIIKSPYPNATKFQEFLFTRSKTDSLASISAGERSDQIVDNLIILPIDQLVVTSTTHIPMLDLLGASDRLVGFPNLKYISSEKIIERIQQGKVLELGKEQSINTEMLLELGPDAVVAFAMNGDNKVLNTIEKAGIPVLLNGDWLEETPLGRAEWIKFFGLLFNKEQQADSIFNTIERDYLEAKALAAKAKTKPTLLSGIQFNQVWNVPAGDSFVASFLKDANVHYFWQDTPGKGSLSLSFEAVFEKARQADIWIDPGQFTTFSQMKNANEHYDQFKAFNTKEIYSYSLKKGPNGGILYYELAAVQPNVVLRDLIKVTHPELLPNYTPFFLKKLKD